MDKLVTRKILKRIRLWNICKYLVKSNPKKYRLKWYRIFNRIDLVQEISFILEHKTLTDGYEGSSYDQWVEIERSNKWIVKA